MPSEKYVIWSHEHRRWWRPNRQGYTSNLSEAGRYTKEEATEITLDVLPPGIQIGLPERVATHWDVHNAGTPTAPKGREYALKKAREEAEKKVELKFRRRHGVG